MRIVVTGATGFIGRNLTARLKVQGRHTVFGITRDTSPAEFSDLVTGADFIFHLAGVNRPKTDAEFFEGNVQLTRSLCQALESRGRQTPIVYSSSIQAALDNPYGRSKRHAEQILAQYAQNTGARVAIYRLPNVFGKWCRPNYNSVVATFCHNIARGLPITISDPKRELELAYIDDVVEAFLSEVDTMSESGCTYRSIPETYRVTLGGLAELLYSFKQFRRSLIAPRFDDPLVRKLYATFLSYLEPDDFAYDLERRKDARGVLAEVLKSDFFGQLFVSRTRPGMTRGNHFHHTKTEKFLVLEGEAVIRFRKYGADEVIEYRVRGEDLRVVDIPPGYTHTITNVGDTELITLFWASEPYDPEKPDTYPLPVVADE